MHLVGEPVVGGLPSGMTGVPGRTIHRVPIRYHMSGRFFRPKA